jgi:hypothetical protein
MLVDTKLLTHNHTHTNDNKFFVLIEISSQIHLLAQQELSSGIVSDKVNISAVHNKRIFAVSANSRTINKSTIKKIVIQESIKILQLNSSTRNRPRSSVAIANTKLASGGVGTGRKNEMKQTC